MQPEHIPIWAPVPQTGALHGLGASLSWEVVSHKRFPPEHILRLGSRKTLINVQGFGEFLKQIAALRAEEVAATSAARKAAQARGRDRFVKDVKSGVRERPRRGSNLEASTNKDRLPEVTLAPARKSGPNAPKSSRPAAVVS